MQEVEATTASPPPPRRVLLISAGGSHSVALISGNVVCSWGRGEDGQLGHGDTDDRLLPTQLSALDAQQIVSVVCGADHTLAYSESKVEVYSWGWGDFGRLGHGNSSDLFIPQPIRALQGLRIKQIACGDSHCLAVTMEGEVQSWGRNQNGQLGLGTTEDSLVPQKIQTFQGVPIKMVAAGAEHSVAITENGELYGWGWGRYGNLGLGDRNDRCIPEKVSVDLQCDKMVLVACGWRHTISVSSSGELYTYGWSKYGQLGHGDCEDHLVPHKLQAFSDKLICQVSGGWRHTMALTTGGQLYGWGWNKFGQVGVGDNVDRCSPVQVKFLHDQKVAQISCGCSDGNFVVTDVNGNIVFKVKGSLLTFRDRRVLVDAADNPITTLRRKIVTMHDRWEAYMGESTDSKDLIFTLKRSSLMQFKTKLDVFLANNTKEDVCDFKVKGSWFERSCTVYAGESNNIVAQMHKKHTVQSLLIGKDHFMVTVYPNVDYAFIVALIVILNEINANEKGSESGLLDEVLLGGV